jgi:transposase InsO family protein
MRRQTEPGQREEFYTRHRAGETYARIAKGYGVSKECVRYWCRRQRDGGGCESRHGRARHGPLGLFDPRVRFSTLRLRLKHPGWGPSRIRHRLRKLYRGLRIPSAASIGRYLHQWPCFRRPPKAKPAATPRPTAATEVHQRWQIDFKMGIALQAGALINLCVVCDEFGRACLTAAVVPTHIVAAKVARVTEEQVRAVLRSCFSQWNTLPDELQTDGEAVFVVRAQDAFPSRFTLWLTGLGIRHLVITPGQPTENAEVERFHRTLTNYAVVGNETGTCAELQQALNQAVCDHLMELPSRAKGCHGRPPLEAYPELLEARHPFRPEHELALFDLTRVDAYLATSYWVRKVGKTGQVNLGGHHQTYGIGRHHAGDYVQVRFDPTDRHFVFYDLNQHEIARRPARNLETADITGLVPWPATLIPQQLPLPLRIIKGVSC